MSTAPSPWAARRQLLLLIGHRWSRRRLMWVPVGVMLALSFALGAWPAAGLLLVLWLSFVGEVMALNSRTAAALVPGHVQRLRELIGAGWLLFAAGVGAAAAALWSLALASLLTLSLLMVLLAAMVRYPSTWVVGWVVPAFSWWWMQLRPVRAVAGAVDGWVAASPAVAALATLVFGLWALVSLIDGRGQGSGQRSTVRDGWSGHAKAPDMPAWASAIGAWMRRQGMRLYHVHRRRLCARPGHAPEARVLLLLGGAHWTGQVTAALVVMAVLAIVFGLLFGFGVFPAPGMQRLHFVGMSLGLMSFALNPLLQMPAGMLRSRREQALLALVPGLPRGAALGRRLALRMTLHHLVAWALASALAMAIVGIGSGDASHIVAAVVFGLLPFCSLLWRDWSAVSPHGGLRVVLQVAGMVLTVALLFVLLRGGEGRLAPVAAASIASTGALLAWRWRRLGTLPGPLPAARRAPA